MINLSDKSTSSTKCFFSGFRKNQKHFHPSVIPDLLGDHLDGLPVEPQVHGLVLRHDLPAVPPDHRLLDQEGHPLSADRDTGTSVRHNLRQRVSFSFSDIK